MPRLIKKLPYSKLHFSSLQAMQFKPASVTGKEEGASASRMHSSQQQTNQRIMIRKRHALLPVAAPAPMS